MRSIASVVLEQAAAGKLARCDFNAIPPGQFRIYFTELSRVCPSRRELGVERRPSNALNVEIGAPLPRCLEQSPDGRGLAWLWSGGHLLAYGTCDRAKCPRAKGGV